MPRNKNIAVTVIALGIAITVFGIISYRIREHIPESSPKKVEQLTESARSAGSKITNKPSQTIDWTTQPLSLKDIKHLSETEMTPVMAEFILNRIKSEITAISDRAQLSGAVISALCRQGYTKEAWNLIDNNPGSIRNVEINEIFKDKLAGIDYLLEKLRGLNDFNDRTAAFAGLIGWRPEDAIRMDFRQIPTDSPYEKGMVAASILSIINGGGNNDTYLSGPLLEKSIQLFRDGNIDQKNLIHILSGDKINNPTYQWKLLDGLTNEIPSGDLERIRASVVPNLVKADATQAMATICSDPSSKYSPAIIKRAIQTLYDVDPKYADQWVNSNLPKIDAATAQRVIFSVAQVAIQGNDFDTATQWSNRLLNPNVRSQLTEQISAARDAKPADN